jgi:hypothetical protein
MENKLLNNLNLISISGCGHSGTTLTATVLGTHKNLLLIPTETRMFIDGSYDINNFIFNNYSDKETMVIEKTPNHLYVLDKIKKEYPDAKFILNIRDPRDIVSSLYNRFEDWNKSIDRLKKDFEYIKKFYSFGYLVKYEDIVNNFEDTFIDICKYINMDFDQNMLEYYKYAPNWYGVENPKNSDGKDKVYKNNISNHEIRRSWQVKQPLFDGTGRWKKELSSSQIDDVVKNVGEVANFFGYTI